MESFLCNEINQLSWLIFKDWFLIDLRDEVSYFIKNNFGKYSIKLRNNLNQMMEKI